MTDFLELRKKMLERTKKQVEHAFGEKEIHIIRASNALTDLEAVFNLLFEHTKEWYQYHFPELDGLVNDPATYLRIVYEIGSRDRFDAERLKAAGVDTERANAIFAKAPESVGAQIPAPTLSEIQLLALNALNLKQESIALEKLLDTELAKIAPNFTRLAGVSIAGRMIAHTGSVEKLALLPASAIQVLGAEKALFRFLKNRKNTLPPKHGYLFAHGLVRQLSIDKRGAMARTLAAKLSIAVRTDYYNPATNVSDALQEKLNRRLAELRAAKNKNKVHRVFDDFRPSRFESRPQSRPRDDYRPKRFEARDARPQKAWTPSAQPAKAFPAAPAPAYAPAPQPVASREHTRPVKFTPDDMGPAQRPSGAHSTYQRRAQQRGGRDERPGQFQRRDRPGPSSGPRDGFRSRERSRDAPDSRERFPRRDRFDKPDSARGRFDRRDDKRPFRRNDREQSDQRPPTTAADTRRFEQSAQRPDEPRNQYTSMQTVKSDFVPLPPGQRPPKFTKFNRPRGKFSSKKPRFEKKKFRK